MFFGCYYGCLWSLYSFFLTFFLCTCFPFEFPLSLLLLYCPSLFSLLNSTLSLDFHGSILLSWAFYLEQLLFSSWWLILLNLSTYFSEDYLLSILVSSKILSFARSSLAFLMLSLFTASLITISFFALTLLQGQNLLSSPSLLLSLFPVLSNCSSLTLFLLC